MSAQLCICAAPWEIPAAILKQLACFEMSRETSLTAESTELVLAAFPTVSVSFAGYFRLTLDVLELPAL